MRGLSAVVVVLAIAAQAAAHAFPDHSEPRVGSTVDRPPGLVQIWFDGAIEPVVSTMRVVSEEKQQVDKGDVRVNPQDSRLLEVSVPPLPAGRYHVYWSVIARDGHRTEGDFRFRVK